MENCVRIYDGDGGANPTPPLTLLPNNFPY